ncbi:MAG: diguanylate cyclase [Nitrospirae bacterium]|nr:diguanylate cyclase [Nitrospirota bacterium]
MTKAKVLLVEDDPIQAKETEDLLINTGYEVLLARDGINAIKLVKSMKPDIILLDLILPGLGGYEVCRWLKLDETAKAIPVIMLTVKKDLAEKISGLQIGADDYLPKPYNALELNARIYACLRTKAIQDELREKNRQLEELLDKVNFMAATDSLTGLFNRRKLQENLSIEFERAKRYKIPFSLVMLDIDYFKKINDDFGHGTGDSVLKEVADIILKSVREIDTAARFGGEEFIIILPNTDRKSAVIVADRMRESLAGHVFTGVTRKITASVGISGMPDAEIVNEDLLLRCADMALYRAKQNGRDRTETGTCAELVKDFP